MSLSSDYRDLLKKEWILRNERNSSYSKRAFARDLGIAPSHLVQVFSRKKEMSENIVEKILERIEWSEEKKRSFWLLFRLQKTKSEKLKNSLARKYHEALHEERIRELSKDEFYLVSDWYHYAIVELTQRSDFVPTPDWISGRLHIDLDLAASALERLLRLGLLERTDLGVRASEKLYTTTQDIPAEAIRSNHLQHLNLAQAALKDQSVVNRDFSGMT